MSKTTTVLLFTALAFVPILVTSTVGPQPPTKPKNDTLEPFRKLKKPPPCTTKQRLVHGHSGVDGENYRWRNGFFVHPERAFNQQEMQTINDAMYELSTVLCIQVRIWPQDSNPTGDYVEIIRGGDDSGCWSDSIGRQGGKQVVNLAPSCIQTFIVEHELMHALGFFHEQSRPDRDDYINIFWENIKPGEEGQFQKEDNSLTFGVPYDLKSVMHYYSTAFSRNGRPTMLAKDGSEIGVNPLLTDEDKSKLKRMYNCQEGGSWVTLYEHINHRGSSIDIRSSWECVNMPSDFNDKASSIDTHNTCMTVFEHGDCQGRSFDYRPGNGHHSNMVEDGFNDMISSIKAC